MLVNAVTQPMCFREFFHNFPPDNAAKPSVNLSPPGGAAGASHVCFILVTPSIAARLASLDSESNNV